MNGLQRIIRSKYARNKYVLTLLVFVVWVSFFDTNSLLSRRRLMNDGRALREDLVYYRNKIQSDSLTLARIRHDKTYVEKAAREEYHMRRKGEVVYVFVEK